MLNADQNMPHQQGLGTLKARAKTTEAARAKEKVKEKAKAKEKEKRGLHQRGRKICGVSTS